MDNKEFEKLDQDLMKGLSGLREKQVPQEIRKNFKRSVEERILGLGRPAPFSFSVFVVPACVLVFGLALCWFYLRPKHVEPLVAEPKPMVKAEMPKVETAKPEAKSSAVVIPEKPVMVSVAKPAEINENELLEEIEALKELGVWTDEDEKDIGISTDQLFEELEIMAGEFSQAAAGAAMPQAG